MVLQMLGTHCRLKAWERATTQYGTHSGADFPNGIGQRLRIEVDQSRMELNEMQANKEWLRCVLSNAQGASRSQVEEYAASATA